MPLPGYNVWTAGDHVMYRVRPGDSLWRISESFLSDGFRWTEIWELNQSREMAGGRRFADPDLILPGWILELPIEAAVVPPAPSAAPVETTPPPVPSPTVASSPTPVPSPTPLPSRTATASPTPVGSTTPEAESVPLQEPTTVPVQQPAGDGSDGSVPWPGAPPLLAAAAGVAAAGTVALVVRRLVRRDTSRRLRVRGVDGRAKRATGDAARVILTARALLRGLAELGFDDLRLVLAREAERFLDFTLDCAPGDAEALIHSRYDLGRRLACAVDGEVVGSTRVRLKLSRFQRLAGLLLGEGTAREGLLLVPVGAADSGLYYLNLAAAGAAAITGTEHETRQLLSAWLATLTAVYGPEELAFLPAGNAVTQLRELVTLPHFAASADAPAERSVQDLAAELEETIVARDDGMTRAWDAALVALAGLGVDYKEDIERLETVRRRGPERRIYMVAAMDSVQDREVLQGFGAAVTFGRPDERLDSGEPGAPRAGPGELVLSLGREPPLILQPVEVRTEVLRPLMRREGPAQYEEAHGGPPQPVDDGREVTTEEQWEDVPPTAEEEIPPDPVEEDRDEASGTRSPEPAEDPESETGDAETVDRSGGQVLAARQSPLLVSEEEAPDAGAANVGGPLFTVRCFGSFRVETAAGEVTGWTIQKAREMLAYLIARGGTPALRDEVAEALWPDGDRAQVDHLLYNAAYYLRRALKSAVRTADMQPLVASAQRYHLRPAMFRVDVDAFDAHLRRAETLEGTDALVEYQRALGLYQGDFVGNEPYEWAEAYRREYQRRFIDGSHRAAKLAMDCRDIAKATEFYKAILARDPIDEEAGRGLMRCYAKLGDLNGVRKVYKVLCESLQRELEDENAEPLPETAAVFHEVTRQ